MTALRTDVDPDGLLEYSVVFTDRSLNHMSAKFQGVMRRIGSTLREVYHADQVAVVPGGGTCAMEAVARQFMRGKRILVVRNGWFSYRWTQIFEAANLPAEVKVITARPVGPGAQAPFAPPPIAEVTKLIAAFRPDVVVAPHVETSAGIILPDDYLTALTDAAHAVGAISVLDCVASGAIWVDMAATGIDVLITAPQKGWSASPSAGLVMLSPKAAEVLAETTSDSFALDLKKWRAIFAAYENGGHAYHSTLPTDALTGLDTAMQEAAAFGFDKLAQNQWTLGHKVRAMFAGRQFRSVAAEGFGAPGVVVLYTDDPAMQNGARLRETGLQVAAGVPLQVGEGADFRTFRIGLFGLDKLYDIDGALARLEQAIEKVT
jgi:aspartate aminotransferase-like enzyme